MFDQILWTACVTPFEEAGTQINYPNLERLLRRQEKVGNGVMLLGSTGESLSLSNTERQEIVSYACSLNLTIPLMVGVPSINLNQALDWLAFCQDLPLAGYLMPTPLYTKPGIHGQIAWFEKLLDRAGKPTMLYNIPGRAGIRLHPESVKELASHPHFQALKECGGTVDSLIDYKIVAPKIALFCGDDYLMPALAAEGAVGLVSIAANAWPRATRLYVEKSLASLKFSSSLWWAMGKALFAASNPIPIKALMADLKLLEYDTVRLPLSLKDLPSREVLKEYSVKIREWEKMPF